MGIYTDKETIIDEHLAAFSINKEIPKVIEQSALKALSHYPELKHTHIRFLFSRKLKKSVMAARPVINTLLQSHDKRVYDILINPVFKLTQSIEPIHHLPADVLIGWFGHELGHLMDYEQRTVWGIAKFGLLYWLSKGYVRKAERVADTFAVNRGMAPYILSTKEFILGHSELSTRYKQKIARLYLSPDDIVELVSEMEKKTQPEKEELLADETALAQSTQEEDN
ncbi:hypothetical protein FXV77_08275 [Sphingobacterium phlebotomi]|uniref:Peptidase M48 domain-containing protein n=1 Tax=Sphingobacterium phlebotomi TaxID=2605433 RepID=A0A5D4H7B4_9SPHI|nr:hypothetical protein [Sphingobacterium phlebotomi]TYR36497.1 hypothetical protein FXV77_08275 [Sphingobacterium phlebotomi]